MYQQFLAEALETHKRGDFIKATEMYNRLLNRQPDDKATLFLLADAYMRLEFNGLAINLLKRLTEKYKDYGDAWCNLGVGYRKENFLEEAKSAWNKALKLQGDTVEVCGNMGSLYADQGKPKEALHWIGRALKCDPNQPEAYWQTSLAQLTMGDFANGWKNYEYRMKLESWDDRKTVDAPRWNGEKIGHLYVHGEQGVGDEVMFASILDEAIKFADKVTLEVNPKVAKLCKLTWPDIEVVEKEKAGKYDAKVSMGTLAYLFRSSADKFTGKAFIKPDESRVQFYRDELAKLGSGPYVAVCWVGGTKKTRVENRSIPISELKPILENFTCVSAQYANGNPFIDAERESAGLHKINDASCGDDLSEQAALFKACDFVVTVQQTAVHVAGAVGTSCIALIAHNPQWRYGMEGTRMPWYESVTLLRKTEKEDWKRVIKEASQMIPKQRKVA